MKTQWKLLVLVICCGLAAPAFAQPAAAEPATAPAPDSVARASASAAPAVAPEGDAVPTLPPENTVPAEAMPTFETTPAPAAAPAPAPVPVVTPAIAPTAVQPAAGPRSIESEGAEEGKTAGQSKCLVGELCMGPVLALGAINALGVGAHARYGQYFGFGLDYQWVPQITFGDVAAGWSLITGEARWYPFGGAFWLGGGLAYQQFNAQVTGHISGNDVVLRGHMGMPAFKLGMGFMGHDGFVMGIDIDANIPLGGTHVGFDKLSGPGAAYAAAIPDQMAKLQTDINSAANKGVKMIPFVPQVNLVRIGYLF